MIQPKRVEKAEERKKINDRKGKRNNNDQNKIGK